jgi:hypothetical protein
MTTVLLLGAGASACMGFPIGSELRKSILDLSRSHRIDFAIGAGLIRTDMSELYQFNTEFGNSQTYSIDAFLARRPEFSDIGKRAIATVLLESESQQDPLTIESDDNWYRYLFNLISSDDWKSLTFEGVSIVTFNYDRSLQTYLLRAIQASYGVSSQQAAEKLKTLRLVHVYGSLGSPFEGDTSYLVYGGGATRDRVEKAAASLRVIPEGRDDDPTLEAARKELESAKNIAILGFGFDETNLKRLNSEVTCRQSIPTNEGDLIRRRIATCLGLTRAEAFKAYAKLGRGFSETSFDLPTDFYPKGCLSALRESLILDK